MKSFNFSLDRIHGYKEQILAREKMDLGVKQGYLNERTQALALIDQQRKIELDNYRVRVQAEGGITPREMSAHRYMMENMYVQEQMETRARDKAQAVVNQQMGVVLRAKQEVSGLDKLACKEREAYQKEEAKESAQDILEYITLTQHR